MKQVVYAELDVLLDTRFGTLIKHSEDLARQVAQNGYAKRTTDNFDQLIPSLDNTVIQTLYKQRDIDTLKLSKMTNVVPIIRDIITELKGSDRYSPDLETIELVVNTHPYTLPDEDQVQIKDVIQYLMGDRVPVNLVSIPPIGLMPSFIESRYSAVFMYDLNGWLTKHRNALIDCKMSDILFFAPRLFAEREPTKQELQEAYSELDVEIDPFKALEISLAEYMSLRMLDIAAYCFVKA